MQKLCLIIVDARYEALKSQYWEGYGFIVVR